MQQGNCVHVCMRALYACGVSNRALVIRILYLCDDVAIRALCRASPSHNVALDVNFYKGFWPVFIFWWLDTTPAWRLLVSCDAQLRSKTAEKQSSVLGWESPAMWTAGLLCLASGDMKTYALIAWPEHLKSGDCTGLVFIQPTHHFLSKTISGLVRMSWSLADSLCRRHAACAERFQMRFSCSLQMNYQNLHHISGYFHYS